jgi:hypothetical protein
MPSLGSISRKDLIRALRRAGFDGPYSGGKHPFMVKTHPVYNSDFSTAAGTLIAAK